MASGLFNLKQQLQGLIQGAWSGTSTFTAPKYLEYLVVAGGGAGGGASGTTSGMGGGGGGGLLQGIQSITVGTSITVTVGSGGTGGASTGGSGLNSVFGTITALGGGGGGTFSATGTSGGSGGAASGDGVRAGAQGTFGQGNAGGSSTNNTGGGGGGAGTVGLNSVGGGGPGSNGGAGIASSISGIVTTYAGGGGGAYYTGSSSTNGLGGVGGGGNSGYVGSLNGVAGTSNTGGGGGGACTNPGIGSGGNGGSGIVIVRYAGNTQYFTGGTLSYDSKNNFTVHTFYSSGTLAPLATPTTYGVLNALTKSLRFRSSNSAYLNRTFSSTPTSWTASFWVKRGQLGSVQTILGARLSGTGSSYLQFNSNDTLGVANNSTSIATVAIYRDPSAWYHFTVIWTSGNTVSIWCNGVLQSTTGSISGANQLFTSGWTSTVGRYGDSATQYFDGELAEVNFIDGQALTPQAFGLYDPTSGVWTPMAYQGTYGTNGFHLTFTNTTSTSTLGNDTSGNSNNWTVNNISLTAGATYDSMNDVPSLTSATAANYSVLNPLNASSTVTFSNGNLNFSYSSTPPITIYSTVGVSSGKFYTEVLYSTVNGITAVVGITLQGYDLPTNYVGSTLYSYGYVFNGNKYNNLVQSAYGATFSSGDVLGIAFDAGAGTLTFYKNGTSQGVAFTGIPSGTYFIGISPGGTSLSTASANFGQQPFTYTPPSGYVALNTYNLPTPAIVQGNKYMDATTYNGLGVTNVIMNAGAFKPDLVWTKVRNQAYGHALFDSIRGVGNGLQSNSTNAEAAWGTSTLSSFNSNGFGLGADTTYLVVNSSGNSFVGWQWQAGAGTSGSNTNGTITSTVSVNTTAGFSIVTYTGTGANATVGHGLGAIPSIIFFKNRSAVTNWVVYNVNATTGSPSGRPMYLNTINAEVANSTMFNSGSTNTTTIFNIGTDTATNGSGNSMVAYCWTPIAGYSSFGTYTGNGSATGPFVYCGFQPKFILVKDTSNNGDWNLIDATRDPYNVAQHLLLPNSSAAETVVSGNNVYILSNGFQIANATGSFNTNTDKFLYMAFAANPFRNSNAF